LQFRDLIHPGLRSFAYGETRSALGLAPPAFQADVQALSPAKMSSIVGLSLSKNRTMNATDDTF